MTEPAPEAVLPDPPAGLPLVVDEQAIAWASLPHPGEPEARDPVRLLERLDAMLVELEPALVAGEVRALVLHGDHPGAFLTGEAPGRVGMGGGGAAEATELVRWQQRILRRLELLPIPTAAALDGPCLALGAALALACSYRVASDAPHARIGFPEVRLGVVPGPGSTVRLPRLVGLQAALELVLSAAPVSSREARALGLVDEVYPARDFGERVRGFVLERLERGRLRPRRSRRVARRLLEDTAPGRRVVLARAVRRIPERLAYAAPAPERALELLADGLLLPLDQAFAREAEVLGALAAGETARALHHAASVVRAAGRSPAHPARPVERVGVLGAGGTGSDLAYLLASAEVPVRLKEIRREALGEGIRHALRLVALDVAAERITEPEADRRAEQIHGTTGFGGFGTLDLVIAAVGDDPDTVRTALQQAAEHSREGCPLAFAAPVLPAERVREGVGFPERVVGLRSVPPLARFPLVEVVGGEAEAAAGCEELLRRLGLVALRVADRPGGLGNRLLGAFLAEAVRLVDEGATVPQVDRVAQEFGFALGPFRRMDAIGVDRSMRLLLGLAAELGDRFLPAPPLERVRESGRDFYLSRAGRPAEVNPALTGGLPGDGGGYAEPIRQRLLLLLINEGAAALQEQVVRSAAEVDAASLVGLGFPRVRGGVMYQAERMGVERVVETLRELAGRFGERFAPAALLEEVAERGTGFSGHARLGVL